MNWTRVKAGLYQSVDNSLRVWKIERLASGRWEVRVQGLHVSTRDTLKQAQRSAATAYWALTQAERKQAAEIAASLERSDNYFREVHFPKG